MPEVHKHSFGTRTVVEVSRGTVEIVRFDRSGKSHSHDVQEVAYCIGGKGSIVCGDISTPYSQGDRVVIPAGQVHYMSPDQIHGPYEWVIWYEQEDLGFLLP